MNDRFATRTPLTPERLEAYIQGRLTPAEQHEVELLLEESPLHAEAVEGLKAVPGASLADLARRRPPAGGVRMWVVVAGTLVVGGVAIAVISGDTEKNASRVGTPVPEAEGTHTTAPDATAQIPLAEITAARDLPESLQIGHTVPRAHAALDTVVRMTVETPIAMEPRSVPVTTTEGAHANAPTTPARKDSRRLIFLRGFKLVDPEELHSGDSWLHVLPNGTPADLDGHDDPQRSITEERDTPYLGFMDHALQLFDGGRNKAALAEFQQVLAQYPDDVNAQFYAGLCCFNLGLFQRAKPLFLSAAHHPVGTFHEEALWYHALAVEQADGPANAELLFERIVAQGGFYAEQASRRIQRAR